ncbi:MAG: NUDIX hydrolase [Spirochaetales bacterium]|jgi:8-oxo-dGTP pyrophosphatase MutT (NUDIX family)|nr:NUDIX hydrolase [Spirochaetales bacterium]
MDKKIDHLWWEEISREKVADARIFNLYKVKRRSPEGVTATFSLIDAPSWVTIVPVTRDEEGRACFVMVRQYRHGSGTVTMEFPAGTVDPGEEPAACAARELEEETGYVPGKLIHLGALNPNPAFINNELSVFLAEDLHQQNGQNLDDHEYVDYHLIPVEKVESEIGTGDYSNGSSMIAMAYYWRWQRENMVE